MTAQINDTVVFNEQAYGLTEIEGSGLFDPKEHGFEPAGFSSACWRGFVCGYEVVDQRLVLARLSMGLSGSDSEKSLLEDVFGKNCSIEVSDWVGTSITNFCLPIPFAGTMLIGRDFIDELYVHMGFHPAYKYKEVWKLEFDDGRMVRSDDISQSMKKYRQTHVVRALTLHVPTAIPSTAPGDVTAPQ
jgi:hypothetical protein